MLLSEFIKQLQQLKAQHGDIPVGSFDPDSDVHEVCGVDVRAGYQSPVVVLYTDWQSACEIAHSTASEVLPKAPDEEPWGDINTSLNYLDTLLNTSAAQVQESIKQVEEMIKHYTKVN